MRKYEYLENALDLFSVELGVGTEAAKQMLADSLKIAEYRSGLQRDLLGIMTDSSIDWRALLENENRTVAAPESDAQGRLVVLDLLWDQVFPGRPRPS